MENDQQLCGNDHHRRHPRLIQPSPPLFADSSTYPSNMRDHTGDQVARSDPWSTVYSLERPELASTLSLEPSMFIACSWEPSLLSQPSSRHMIIHDHTLYPESNHYPSTPLLAQENTPLDNMLPARRNFLGTNITSSEQPLLESSADQMALSRRAPDSDHNFLPASQFQVPYGLQASPRSQTQSRASVASPLPLNYPRENKKATRLSPTSSYTSSRSQNKPLKDEYTKQVGVYDKPYAYLLYEALRSAKDHRLSLQEIYRWFEDNTNKASDPNSKGWQSSIRHNLSMNEVSSLLAISLTSLQD
jgi:Forkhead domain